MIHFEKVSFSYEKGKRVLDELSFHIAPGEAVGLIGANGAGKSTLLKLMLGLCAGEGLIEIGGLAMAAENLPAIRKKLGLVLQNSDQQLFMPTVYEDMVFGPLNYGLSREEADRRVDETLEKLGQPALRNRYNHKLSGGEKRMAAIATVLAMEPEAVLMDEPSAALDPCNRRAVIRAIQSLPQTRLIASHDLDLVLDTCERVILLSHGAVAADGPAASILRDRALLEANRLELPLRFQR